MWPWEHAAAGYLLYSLLLRASGREPPSDAAAVALAIATQLPDLVDKPLSWGFGVFPTGYALGHSVFLAVPLGAAALAWGVRAGEKRLGAAFVVGYWSHLAGDVLDPLRSGGQPLPGRILWPVVDPVPYEQDLGLGRGLVYLESFLASLGSADPITVLTLYLLLPLATVGLWISDGAPGLAPVVRALDTLRERVRNTGQ